MLLVRLVSSKIFRTKRSKDIGTMKAISAQVASNFNSMIARMSLCISPTMLSKSTVTNMVNMKMAISWAIITFRNTWTTTTNTSTTSKKKSARNWNKLPQNLSKQLITSLEIGMDCQLFKYLALTLWSTKTSSLGSLRSTPTPVWRRLLQL